MGELLDREETLYHVPEQYREYVPNVYFKLIPARNLVSSQDYQRNLSTAGKS